MVPPPQDPRSDQDLVAAINRGDPRAFESLYLRHRDFAVRLAHRFTGDRDSALDVMQEAFLYLLKKFPGFRLTSRFTTFLYPVVRHIALEHRRKTLRLNAAGDSLPDPAAPAVSPTHSIADLLAPLPEEHREVLAMRFVDGFTLDEIAAALSIPLGTVKSRLHHGLQKIRDDPLTKNFFNS